MLSTTTQLQVDSLYKKIRYCDRAILSMFDPSAPPTTITIYKAGSDPLVLECDPIDTSFLLSFYMAWKARYTRQLRMITDVATSPSTPETPVDVTTNNAVGFP